MAKSTESAKKCAISRKSFNDKAKPLSIKVNDVLHSGDVKEFATGSFGWHSQGKITVEVDALQHAQITAELKVVCVVVVAAIVLANISNV